VVEAVDKFGPMGLVCAALLDPSESELRIPVFVLSCRVLGYGIEDAVLGAVKRLAWAHRAAGGRPLTIRGAYRETLHNEPCRTMYPRQGFSRDGDSWVLAPAQTHEDPKWLTIVDHLCSTPAAFAG
jgi:predicted enzyme involved in methoxymalonyl-ACP biosynthesis